MEASLSDSRVLAYLFDGRFKGYCQRSGLAAVLIFMTFTQEPMLNKINDYDDINES